MFGIGKKTPKAKPQNVAPTKTGPLKAKAKPKKAKGLDNNKRLAVLEAKEAARIATNKDRVAKPGEVSSKVKLDPAADHPRFYDAGRRARAANIGMNQAPVMSDAERAAYEKGYGPE